MVTSKKMGFKVWEYTVFLFDSVIAKAQIQEEDIHLFALTCLLIAYKVDSLQAV